MHPKPPYFFRQKFLAAPLLGLSLLSSAWATDPSINWPNWRGLNNTGAATDARPPLEWSTTKNVRWKVEIPGKGSSTPIVYGDQIFILTAIRTDKLKEGVTKEQAAEAEKKDAGSSTANQPTGSGVAPAASSPNTQQPPNGPGGGVRRAPPAEPVHFYRFVVLSYNRNTGEKLWERTVTEQVPHEAGHNTNNFASSSPTTDGNLLYVSFGSRGIYALDLKGNIVWNKDIGKMETRNQFGEGVSPTVFRNRLIVPWDQERDSFLLALDAKDGSVQWRVDRDEKTGWATPLVVEHKGKVQVITNGKKVRSYDLQDGKLIWEAAGQTDNPIPTPILHGDWVLATTGFRGANAFSISLNSTGDVTNNKQFVRWQHAAGTPYVPSPTLYQDKVYFLKNNNGIISSLNAVTGEVIVDQKRVEGVKLSYASLGAANGRIYVTDRDGTTVVLSADRELNVLATNRIDEEVDASPVFVGNDLLLRGEKHLYCLSEAQK